MVLLCKNDNVDLHFDIISYDYGFEAINRCIVQEIKIQFSVQEAKFSDDG
jgi:hypothetical protein